MAAASRFAHLFGLGAKKTAADDKEETNAKGEKPTQNEGESDEDFQKRLKKWEDDQDDGESAENPKDTSDDDQDKEGKKKAMKEAADAARAEGVVQGAAAERTRWSTVLASKAATGRGMAAISLLADTDMAAPALEKTLAALPAETARTTLANRQPAPTPAPAPDAPADPATLDGPKGFAARVQAAVGKVRPSKSANAA